MAGRLFVVGIGPGDPELMTLKAVRVLNEVPCIFVPKGREEGGSLALSIVRKALDLSGKEIIEAYFPMVKTARSSDEKGLHAEWSKTVDSILTKVQQETDAVFITIGDPAIYSTFFYLSDTLLQRMPSLRIEIVPGISSINASAARAGLSLGLGNDRIAILPANYPDSLQETLEKFDTVVLMKVNRVFSKVRDALEQAGLAQHAVYVARAGMEDERVIRDITSLREQDLNYFSLIIVRKP